MSAAQRDHGRIRRVSAITPEAATGWLRFGVMALPKTAPPQLSFPH